MTYGAVRTLPHLLQIEFLHSCFVWRDSCAFDSDIVLLYSLGGVDRDLVICLVKRVTTSVPGCGMARLGEGTYGVPGLESKVVILDIEVKVGEN